MPINPKVYAGTASFGGIVVGTPGGGADGDDGEMGPPGVPGTAGSTGSAGAPGADGSIGPPGVAGNDGDDGPAGIPGTLVGDFKASGAASDRGMVPNPGAAAGTTRYLREDATWQAPTAVAADPSYAPGSFTLATGTFRMQSKRLTLTGAQRATLQGTARIVGFS